MRETGRRAKASRTLLGGRGLGALAAAVLAVALTACTASTGGSKGSTSITFAEQPGAAPNYLLPLASAQHFTGANYFRLIYQMYRPLYWMTTDGKLQVNDQLSLAAEPTFSSDDKTVTIKLKNWKWSDGTPITARDVQFWQNLVTANKDSWASYVPGEYPDNVVSTKVVDPSTIAFTLDRAYNPQWFLYNELSQIVPIPQKVWDKTSASGAIGDADMTSSGATAVYTFLDKQATDTSSYATNRLWQTVDGPWKLKTYSLNGPISFTRNTAYSGPVNANYDTFTELPYTSAAAEYNAVLSGSVDYGYIPANQLTQSARVKQQGYQVALWPHWGINFIVPNYNNTTTGSLVQQVYIRQAMEETIDQPTDIQAFYGGQATPTYGPVPKVPSTAFLTSAENTNMYPYSPTDAKALLTSHGWSVGSGAARCQNPGSGANQCGPGIAEGAELSFTLLYASGNPAFENTIQAFKSAASQAGIQINLTSAPANEVSAAQVRCTPGQAACQWQLIANGNGWGYGLDYQPSGDEILTSGAGSNWGSYSDKTTDSLIEQTHYSDSTSAFGQLEAYLTKNIPLIWLPEQPVQVSAIRNNIQGVGTQGPLLAITPEMWSVGGK